MKTTIKFLLIGFVFCLGACDLVDLELQNDPNAVTPERADVNDLFNKIQIDFNDIFNATQQGGNATRMYHAGGNFTYAAWADPTDFNFLYGQVYNDMFPDIDALIPLADAAGLDVHSGSAKVMKAYAMMALVDMLGDVPFSEAGKGTDVISPTADSGSSIYAASVGLLDEAIAGMTGTAASGPSSDIFYGGSPARWVTLAKTLKLRAAVTTRLVDGGAASTINALVAEGDIIDEQSEDFQYNYGNQRANPNSRHWMYNSHYETGDGAYLSNSFMYMLRAEKRDAAGNPIKDPRLRYYFYRKVDDSVGQDLTTYSCHFSAGPDQDATPAHYTAVDPNMPYCYAWEDGYIGRDHLNGEGIPPDGPIRTSYGLYPGGGQFDLDEYADTRQVGTSGGMGQGISPIMLSSFVDFMRAEAALTIGTSDDPRALLESGMRKSIAKVIGFEGLVSATMSDSRTLRDGSQGTVKELFGASQDDVDAYVDQVLANYDAAGNKLDVVMKEYYIALWGNGIESYNMYRRTGLPSNIGPSLEPDAGAFPRSFFLPANYVNRNANREQKADLTERVFWDDGSASLR